MEELYVQQKYLMFASSSLSQFKRRGDMLWNFRCPYCGDSQRNQSKARGYVYRNKERLLSYQCHNCGENHKFKRFLQDVAPNLYAQYVLESFKGQTEQPRLEPIKNDSQMEQKPWRKVLVPIEKLSKLHPVRGYVKQRAIPQSQWGRLFYCQNLQEAAHKLGIDQVLPEDERLVLVETDAFDNLILIVCRAMGPSDLRYVTLKLDEDAPKLFGRAHVDYSKPVYVVEGAIDSLFLDNCIASLDANLLGVRQGVPETARLVFIWDNEPRSPNTVRRIDEAITKNAAVVIWPSHIMEKDVNHMVLNGKDVNEIVKAATYSGIGARLKFSTWKRTDENATRRKAPRRIV